MIVLKKFQEMKIFILVPILLLAFSFDEIKAHQTIVCSSVTCPGKQVAKDYGGKCICECPNQPGCCQSIWTYFDPTSCTWTMTLGSKHYLLQDVLNETKLLFTSLNGLSSAAAKFTSSVTDPSVKAIKSFTTISDTANEFIEKVTDDTVNVLRAATGLASSLNKFTTETKDLSKDAIRSFIKIAKSADDFTSSITPGSVDVLRETAKSIKLTSQPLADLLAGGNELTDKSTKFMASILSLDVTKVFSHYLEALDSYYADFDLFVNGTLSFFLDEIRPALTSHITSP